MVEGVVEDRHVGGGVILPEWSPVFVAVERDFKWMWWRGGWPDPGMPGHGTAAIDGDLHVAIANCSSVKHVGIAAKG